MTEKKTETKTETKTAAETEAAKNELTENEQTAPEPIDFSPQIGANFNLKNATEIFGKANAERAVRAAATAGGYGEVSAKQLEDGLAMPSGDSAAMRDITAQINAALNQLK